MTAAGRLGVVGTAAVLLAASASAAERVWTGVIGDSMCGASHSGEHGGNEMTDAACVISCVESGEKYVLVSDGKSWAIENQDFAGLASAAGTEVRLAGESDGDGIRVTGIEPLRKPKEREKG